MNVHDEDIHEELNDQVEIAQQIQEQTDDAPVAPLAGVVYGDTIYWITVAGAVITLLGQIWSFVAQSNYMSPTYVLSSIWQGKNVDEIWSAVGGVPNGHWYLPHLWTGDGLTMAGLALGVFGVTPAIFASALVLYRQGQRLFGSLAVIAGLITVLALTGVMGGLIPE